MTIGDGGGPEGRFRLGRIAVVGAASAWGACACRWAAAVGFDVIECGDNGGVAAWLARGPDLVVLAADWPPDTTAQACAAIRARSEVPLVVLSVHGPSLAAESVLDAGADLCLRAPLGEPEFAARLRAALRRYPPRPVDQDGAVLRFGGLALDRERQRLDHPRGTIELEGREYLLMEALMLAAPAKVPRQRLRELLGAGDPALDGAVRRLRERLHALDGWRRIETVRGVGFRLAERPPCAEPPPASERAAQRRQVIDLRDELLPGAPSRPRGQRAALR